MAYAPTAWEIKGGDFDEDFMRRPNRKSTNGDENRDSDHIMNALGQLDNHGDSVLTNNKFLFNTQTEKERQPNIK